MQCDQSWAAISSVSAASSKNEVTAVKTAKAHEDPRDEKITIEKFIYLGTLALIMEIIDNLIIFCAAACRADALSRADISVKILL